MRRPISPECAARSGSRLGPLVRHRLEIFRLTVLAFRPLDFLARVLAAQIVQANVHHHAIKPGGKTRFRPEVTQRAVNLQERLLVKIPSLFRGMHDLHRQAKHVLIVGAHQCLEGFGVAFLGATD